MPNHKSLIILGRQIFGNMVTAIGLPLLMVDGKFKSLGSMTVADLETFIPFLVKCSVHRAGASLIDGVPEWWSSTIKYKFPLQKPQGLSLVGYRRHLSSIVCRCYWYHDAQYLLPFCAEIANSPESVFFKNNDDNTTSIFYVHNTILVMKFSNENKNYDMEPKKKKEKNHRLSLLPALPKKTTNIPDIYLCENCDAEFSSHSDMVKHEKDCYEIVSDEEEEEEEEDLDSSQEIQILEHIKPSDRTLDKNDFFNYMQLQSNTSKNLQKSSKVKKNGMESHVKRWVNSDMCQYKNRKVEFSSLAGRKMLEFYGKKDFFAKIQKTLSITEAYCCTSFVRPFREVRELTDFKVTSKKQKRPGWSHQYCFNKQQRRCRYLTLKTGLDENSRKLLKQCKKLQIVLNRLKVSL